MSKPTDAGFVEIIGVQGSRVPFITCNIPSSIGVGALSVVIVK